MVEAGLNRVIAGEEMWLLPERVLYWPRRRALILADLHWGKVETFRRSGIPMPEGILEDDLARLTRAIRNTGAERIWVLGDLIHHHIGLSPRLVDQISSWREELSLEFVLIRGNHDRWIKELPAPWNISIIEEFWEEGPFCFSHALRPGLGKFVWCGHLHPAFRLYSSVDHLRFPCFVLKNDLGILPAFSSFTGGQDVHWEKGMEIFPIFEGQVLNLGR